MSDLETMKHFGVMNDFERSLRTTVTFAEVEAMIPEGRPERENVVVALAKYHLLHDLRETARQGISLEEVVAKGWGKHGIFSPVTTGIAAFKLSLSELFDATGIPTYTGFDVLTRVSASIGSQNLLAVRLWALDCAATSVLYLQNANVETNIFKQAIVAAEQHARFMCGQGWEQEKDERARKAGPSLPSDKWSASLLRVMERSVEVIEFIDAHTSALESAGVGGAAAAVQAALRASWQRVPLLFALNGTLETTEDNAAGWAADAYDCVTETIGKVEPGSAEDSDVDEQIPKEQALADAFFSRHTVAGLERQVI